MEGETTNATHRPELLSEYPLFKTEQQIAAMVGVGIRTWRTSARVLERSGLPKGDPLFCGRRYWPAVRAFLDRRYALGNRQSPLQPDGVENWDQPAPRFSRRRS